MKPDEAQTVGDQEAGFTVTMVGPVVQLVGWGFWSPEVATQLDRSVLHACQRTPRPAELVCQLTELKPMREEGQAAMVRLLREIGAIPVTMVTRSQLTRLQLMRLVKENTLQDKVTFR